MKKVTKKTIAARECLASILVDEVGDICESRIYQWLVLAESSCVV